MDFQKLITDSAKFAWKYKILWIFGFIVAFFSGSGGSNFRSNSGSNYSYSPGSMNNPLKEYFSAYSSPALLMFVIIFCFIVLALIVISLYLSNVAEASLIIATQKEKAGKESEIKFGMLWKESHKYIWNLIGVDFFLFLIGMVSIVIIAFSAIFPLLLCLTVPVLVLVVIVVAIAAGLAKMDIVINGTGSIQAMQKGFELFFKKIGDLILAFLVSLIPGCIFGLVFIAIAFFMFIPFFAIGIGMGLASESGRLTLAEIGFLLVAGSIINLVISVIAAPYKVFHTAYWVKVYNTITGKDTTYKTN
jgi:hypothetical protein